MLVTYHLFVECRMHTQLYSLIEDHRLMFPVVVYHTSGLKSTNYQTCRCWATYIEFACRINNANLKCAMHDLCRGYRYLIFLSITTSFRCFILIWKPCLTFLHSKSSSYCWQSCTLRSPSPSTGKTEISWIMSSVTHSLLAWSAALYQITVSPIRLYTVHIHSVTYILITCVCQPSKRHLYATHQPAVSPRCFSSAVTQITALQPVTMVLEHQTIIDVAAKGL